MDEQASAARGWRGLLKSDFPASVVVFLVALPLCMGIAIASGAPVAAGLITGIVGGLVTGMLAGCPLQVSGPAAGLTVIVFDVIQRDGLEVLGLVVLLAGLIQMTAGLLRLGQWFRAVSPAVIKGMLSGIGVLIFASQFHVMVDDKPKGTGLENLATIPAAIGKALATPEVAPREQRLATTAALRTTGELQRRQTALGERIVSLLPRHDVADQRSAEGTDSPLPAEPPVDLLPLVSSQEAITAQLQEEVVTIAQLSRAAFNGDRGERIRTAAQAALEQSQKALDDLRQQRIDSVDDSQRAAGETLGELLNAMKNHVFAAHIGLVTILAILLWQGLAPRRLRLLPAPLVAVVVATIGAALLALPVLYVEVPDNLWQEIHLPNWSLLREVAWTGLLQSALVIALVASAETLLCAVAVDQIQQGPRTKYDKELFAQGVGNAVCGCLSALPMTGVIVRSTANIEAGGKTRLSAILHGVWLLVFVSALAFLLRLIPTSCLAGMLVYTGYKLMNFRAIAELRRYGWGEVAIFAVTVVTIVVTDLLTGVIVGVVLSAAKLLYTFSHLHADLVIEPGRHRAVLSLAGSATFLRLPRLAAELDKVPGDSELHVDFEHLDYIDHACLDLLMNWASQHESSGGRLVIDWESLHARFDAQAAARVAAANGAAASAQP